MFPPMLCYRLLCSSPTPHWRVGLLRAQHLGTCSPITSMKNHGHDTNYLEVPRNSGETKQSQEQTQNQAEAYTQKPF